MPVDASLTRVGGGAGQCVDHRLGVHAAVVVGERGGRPVLALVARRAVDDAGGSEAARREAAGRDAQRARVVDAVVLGVDALHAHAVQLAHLRQEHDE